MKKIISVLVAVLLLCTLIPAVFAAEGTVYTVSSIRPDGTEVPYIQKGDEVTVTVYQSGTACMGGKLTGFTYDKAALELIGTMDNGYAQPVAGAGLFAAHGPNGINFAGMVAGTDRVVLTLTFKVLAEAGEFTVSFAAAEADGTAATVNGGVIVVGAPHEHAFGEWTVVKAPTCTETGLEERVCACGEKETREVAALGHDWDEGVLPETYDCDDVLKTFTCKNDASHTKTEDASHDHKMVAYAVSERTAEDGSYYITYQDKCAHAADHGCTEVGETYEKLITGPITGDITPYIAMGVLTMVALVSAAAYMLLKRKAI